MRNRNKIKKKRHSRERKKQEDRHNKGRKKDWDKYFLDKIMENHPVGQKFRIKCNSDEHIILSLQGYNNSDDYIDFSGEECEIYNNPEKIDGNYYLQARFKNSFEQYFKSGSNPFIYGILIQAKYITIIHKKNINKKHNEKL